VETGVTTSGEYFMLFLVTSYLTSWQVRPLYEAQGQVRTRPGKAQAARVHEVRGAQRAVRVAGGRWSGSGSGQGERQGEGGCDVTAVTHQTGLVQ